MSASAATSGTARPGSAAWRRLSRGLIRPEMTAVIGTLAVFVYFALTAGSSGFLTSTSAQNASEVAAQVGIIAAVVTLLLVAGEFDLSVGAIMGASQVLFAYPLVNHGWPLWAAALLTVGGCALLGMINGLLVVRTLVPSFIITLGGLFWIRGTAQGTTNSLTGGTTVPGVREAQPDGGVVGWILGGEIAGFSVAVIWFVVIVALCAWVLHRTAFGNRIYATGGNVDAARRSGVTSNRVKLWLFVATAISAGIVGMLSVYQINQADVTSGTGLELQTIAAAVIGGAALTGGFGSPVGSALGAILFGMVTVGFFFTSVPDEWYQTFVGVILIFAVLINERTRALLLRPGGRS